MNRSEARQNFMENYDESFMDGIDDETFRHRFIIQLVDLSRMDETGQEISQVSGIVKAGLPERSADPHIGADATLKGSHGVGEKRPVLGELQILKLKRSGEPAP